MGNEKILYCTGQPLHNQHIWELFTPHWHQYGKYMGNYPLRG